VIDDNEMEVLERGVEILGGVGFSMNRETQIYSLIAS
jgi:hypothetical protein